MGYYSHHLDNNSYFSIYVCNKAPAFFFKNFYFCFKKMDKQKNEISIACISSDKTSNWFSHLSSDIKRKIYGEHSKRFFVTPIIRILNIYSNISHHLIGSLFNLILSILAHACLLYPVIIRLINQYSVEISTSLPLPSCTTRADRVSEVIQCVCVL